MILGTVIRPLKRLVDERGYLMEMMRLEGKARYTHLLRDDWPDVFKAVPMSYALTSYPAGESRSAPAGSQLKPFPKSRQGR